MNVTVLLDGVEVVNRDVDSIECEETAGGTLSMQAVFPPIVLSGPPTGTLVDLSAAYPFSDEA